MHGYDHPWAGGAGKNGLNVTATTTTDGGVTFTVNSDGTVTANGTATESITFNLTNGFIPFPSGNYIINGGVDNNIRVYANPDRTQGYYSGGADSVAFNVSTELVARIQIESGTVCNNALIKPMIRLSTVTDSAFAPYSNICPISGRTGTTVTTRNEDNTETASATISFGTTVYGGQVDFKTGNVTVEWGYIASYNGESLPGAWISDRDVYAAGTTPTTDAEVCYELATPTTLSLTPDILTMLKNNNSVSGDGVITITALTGDSWS